MWWRGRRKKKPQDEDFDISDNVSSVIADTLTRTTDNNPNDMDVRIDRLTRDPVEALEDIYVPEPHYVDYLDSTIKRRASIERRATVQPREARQHEGAPHVPASSYVTAVGSPSYDSSELQPREELPSYVLDLGDESESDDDGGFAHWRDARDGLP